MTWSWALARPGYVDEREQHLTRNVMDRFVAGDLSISAEISSRVDSPGSTVSTRVIVHNTHSNAARLLIDVAVVGANGSVDSQHVSGDETLEPGEVRSFDSEWTVQGALAAGSGKLIVAAFAPD